jgi:hypothetical protein
MLMLPVAALESVATGAVLVRTCGGAPVPWYWINGG